MTVILTTVFGSLASAADRYVSPTGNHNNPGIESQPWQTLAYAFGQLNAGDTLFMRGGTYRETGITLSNSGSSGSVLSVINVAIQP